MASSVAYGPGSMLGGRRKSFEAEDGLDMGTRLRGMNCAPSRYNRASALPVIPDGSPTISASSSFDDRFSRSDGLMVSRQDRYGMRKNRSLPRANSDSGFIHPNRYPYVEVKRNHSLKVSLKHTNHLYFSLLISSNQNKNQQQSLAHTYTHP